MMQYFFHMTAWFGFFQYTEHFSVAPVTLAGECVQIFHIENVFT